ncbi:PLC-like phosphodiesterase [Mycena floridula]|nr:PLC-like phosphodiesterase [Mycena floridula]
MQRSLPDCWGHRGASARFPENTLASFEAAIQDGAEGLESDVHVSSDNVVLMFHDPTLDRTTNLTGAIADLPWYGPNGIEHARTVKAPVQAIPTFAETISLLLMPGNTHVHFNVDVKVQNDPKRLFGLMNDIITSHEGWEERIAPRILLGLWHPAFLEPAKEVLPYLSRSYIGSNLEVARKWFWKDCQVFSIKFAVLASSDGAKFRKEAKEQGKRVMVWTVNEPDEMMEAVRWDVNTIITDHTRRWLDLRSKLESDYEKLTAQHSRLFLWTTLKFYPPFLWTDQRREQRNLERIKGPFAQAIKV